MDALQGFLVSLQRSGHKATSFQVTRDGALVHIERLTDRAA